jgi:hypothetical protein
MQVPTSAFLQLYLNLAPNKDIDCVDSLPGHIFDPRLLSFHTAQSQVRRGLVPSWSQSPY